jgi:hypothetical protein
MEDFLQDPDHPASRLVKHLWMGVICPLGLQSGSDADSSVVSDLLGFINLTEDQIKTNSAYGKHVQNTNLHLIEGVLILCSPPC